MADDKKPAGGSPFHKNHYQEVYVLLGALLLIGLLLQRAAVFWADVGAYGLGGAWVEFVSRVKAVWQVWKPLGLILSFAALVWAVYTTRKLREIEKEEAKIFGAPVGEESVSLTDEPVSPENPKWERIITLANSSNSSDWRLAILEADIMLDDLLRANGYDGEGVGEMLKAVEPSDMLTLDAAWDAHKVRNKIAHDANFELSERETRRVISLFESVFKEFQII